MRVGTCAWSDHTGFYPPGLAASARLPYYTRFFPLVEIDSTFYRPATPRDCARWAERSPDGFCFHLKVYRALTWHDRQALPTPESLRAMAAETATAAAPLRESGKLTCLHWQFAPWFMAGPESTAYLRAVRQALSDWPLAVEFRHRSWFADAESQARTLQTMRDLGMTHTVCDEPQLGSGSVPPVLEATTDLGIVRLHGRNTHTWYAKAGTSGERFHYRYSREELTEWVSDVTKLAATTTDIHILFNNNHEDDAVRNAAEFAALLDLGYPDPWAGRLL